MENIETTTTEVNEVVTSPVFNSQEEAQAWLQSQAQPDKDKPEAPAAEKPEEVRKPEAPTETKVETPVVDFRSMLNERFGVEDEEAIKEALGRPVIDDETRALLDEVKYFKENPWALELAKYASKPGADVPLYAQVSKLDVGKLTDADALILDLVFEKGLTKEEATAKVQRDHSFALVDDSELDANEKLAAGADMKLQANEARKRLAEFQQGIKIPEAERKAADTAKQAQQIEAQRKEAWKPEVKKIVTDYTYSHKGDYGVEDLKTGIDYKMPLTDELQKQFQGVVENLIANTQFDVKKDRENVVELAAALFERQNREALLKEFAKHVISQRDADWAKKVYGVDPGAQRYPGPDNTQGDKIVVHNTGGGDSDSWKRW